MKHKINERGVLEVTNNPHRKDKLCNDVILEQLQEMEYAIRDGLVLGKRKKEIISLCKAIIELTQDRFCA
jgi:hypothetical protein